MFFPLNLLDIPASTGFAYAQQRELVGHILAGCSEQLTAATAAALRVSNCAPLLQDAGSPKISFVCPITAAAGESMAVVVNRIRAGSSTALTTSFTYDSTKTAGTVYPLTLVSAALPLLKGDVIAVARTYTAGGGPTPITDTKVVVVPCPEIEQPNGS